MFRYITNRMNTNMSIVLPWFKTSLLFNNCIASPTKKKQKKEGENKWKRRRLLFNSQIVYYLMNLGYLHNSIKKAWDTTKIEDIYFWVRFRSVMQSCANNIYKKLLWDYVRIFNYRGIRILLWWLIPFNFI